ncbi:unnamed protein product [Psylliodes chrysocephalus]|uniref:CCHC-type domain-containing protein n=1 Tax=Psylliodes chrysocephalus TaxID=3402493 RepID=A0A9P0CWZ3_9CUCU|nr:unnamed protein product [Psylliodes chrysocephala]
MADTISDYQAVKRENTFLKQENDLLKSLNNELKCNNDLLKEKLVPHNFNMNNGVSTNTLSYQHKPAGSYSSALKTINNKPGLLIKSKSQSRAISNIDILKDVQSNINPVDQNVKIEGVRKIKNGIIVNCENDTSLNNLKSSVLNIFGSKYSAEPVKKFNPRIVLKDVDLQDSHKDEDIINEIFSLNDLEDFSQTELKIVTKLKFYNNINLVLELTPSLRNFIFTKGFLYIGWKKCYFSDHIRILKCKKCLSFGHIEKNCNFVQKCGTARRLEFGTETGYL